MSDLTIDEMLEGCPEGQREELFWDLLRIKIYLDPLIKPYLAGKFGERVTKHSPVADMFA